MRQSANRHGVLYDEVQAGHKMRAELALPSPGCALSGGLL
jgi:hypothetical protein